MSHSRRGHPASAPHNVLASLALALALLLSQVGCGGTGVGSSGSGSSAASSSSSAASSSSSAATAALLANAEAVEGSDNLYELHADCIADGGYSELVAFDGNLLFVSMYAAEPTTTDGDASSDATDGEGWEPVESLLYRFDLYSPAANDVVATVDTAETGGDSYQVVGSELLVTDSAAGTVSIYDASLSLTGTYDISDFAETTDGLLYPTGEEGTYYLLDCETSALQTISLTDGSIESSDCLPGLYLSSVGMASPDASKLLLHVVDEETFRSSYLVADATTLPASSSALRSYADEPISYAEMSDEMVLAWMSSGIDLCLADWLDGEGASYFQVPEDASVTLLGPYVMATRDTLYDTEAAERTFSAAAYDEEGTCISAMTFAGDADGDGEAERTLLRYPALLEDGGCAVTGVYDSAEDETYLLVWDLSEPGEGTDVEPIEFCETVEEAAGEASEEEIAEDEAAGVLVTRIADRDAYDWGDLADARSRADALENAYGVSIYLGPEVPSCVSDHDCGQCLDAGVVAAGLDALEQVLALYPEGFFDQLLYGDMQGIRIYLAGTLSSDEEGALDEAGGYVADLGGYLVMVLDTYQYWNWDYIVNHEVSHMIDRALAYRAAYRTDMLFSEEAWADLNPDGFSYLESYEDYEESAGYQTWPEWFIDAYGTTYATEDRAEVFGEAVSDYLYDGFYEYDLTRSAINAKLSYYSACIRDGFETTGWPDELPWEKYV